MRYIRVIYLYDNSDILESYIIAYIIIVIVVIIVVIVIGIVIVIVRGLDVTLCDIRPHCTALHYGSRHAHGCSHVVCAAYLYSCAIVSFLKV